jgi:hypothetical protein
MPIPIKMATGIPDRGMAKAVESADAAAKPLTAVTAERVTPGTNALVDSEIENGTVTLVLRGGALSSSLGIAEKWRIVQLSSVTDLLELGIVRRKAVLDKFIIILLRL